MKDFVQPIVKEYHDTGNISLLSIIPLNVHTILDVGCGSGDNAKLLYEQGKKVDCVTISEEEFKTAKKYCSNIYIKNLEEGLPEEILNKKYDVVICSHVIEHIAYPKLLFDDIKKVLHPATSNLIIALPNFLVYKNRIKIFFGNFTYEKSGVMDYTHLRWYTYNSGHELLNNFGFKVTSIVIDGNIPFASYLKFLPDSMKSLFKKLLFLLSPGLFGGQFIYTAIKE